MKRKFRQLYSDLTVCEVSIKQRGGSKYAEQLVNQLMETPEGQNLVIGSLKASIELANAGTDKEGNISKRKWWHIVFDSEFRRIVWQLVQLAINFYSSRYNQQKWIK